CVYDVAPTLVLTKTCPPTPTLVGDLLVFTGSVSNAGQVTVTNVVIVNDQPTNRTPVTNFVRLAPGDFRTFTGSYRVPTTSCPTGMITDTLTVTATSLCDPNLSTTNTISAMCPVTCVSNCVALTVGCSNIPPPGSTLVFTGLVSNCGLTTLTNVCIT